MSVHSEIKKITTETIRKMKQDGEKISMLTAYDFTTARMLDAGGIDTILVGDSAANVMAGYDTTLPITLDHMIYHAQSVVRGIKRALVVVDLPFGSYQCNPDKALDSAIRIMKETGASAIKLEGGSEVADSIKKIVNAEIFKTYAVDHDATIVEEDGTEVRIAPLDVQYQNASIWGRLITNFAGPMNNFILSVLVFMLLAFVQGGVRDENSNHFQVMDGSAIAAAGIQNNDQILKINDYEIGNWADLTSALAKITAKSKEAPTLSVTYKHGSETKEITV